MIAEYCRNRRVQITVCGLDDKARRDREFLKALRKLYDAAVVALKRVEGVKSLTPAPNEDYGARLRRFRQGCGLKQVELALETGIAQSYISALELGHKKRPSAGASIKLANCAEARGRNEDADWFLAQAGLARTRRPE